MYTWHHALWMYITTYRRQDTLWWILGAVLPDLIYAGLLAALLGEQRLGWQEVGQLNPWQLLAFLPEYPWVRRIDLWGHAVPVWAAMVMLAVLLPERARPRWVWPLLGGWGLHLAIDTLTHGAYANYWLYPFSWGQWHSPVSYWEEAYAAREFAWLNRGLLLLAFVCLGVRWWQYKRKK